MPVRKLPSARMLVIAGPIPIARHCPRLSGEFLGNLITLAAKRVQRFTGHHKPTHRRRKSRRECRLRRENYQIENAAANLRSKPGTRFFERAFAASHPNRRNGAQSLTGRSYTGDVTRLPHQQYFDRSGLTPRIEARRGHIARQAGHCVVVQFACRPPEVPPENATYTTIERCFSWTELRHSTTMRGVAAT